MYIKTFCRLCTGSLQRAMAYAIPKKIPYTITLLLLFIAFNAAYATGHKGDKKTSEGNAGVEIESLDHATITYSFDDNLGTITSFGPLPISGSNPAYPFLFSSMGTGSGSLSNFGGEITNSISGGNILDYVHTVSRTDAVNFDLQSLTVENGFGFAGNVIITGFRNGNPVATTTETMPANFQAILIDLTGNDDFNDVSEFQVTFTGTLGTAWGFRDITIGDAIPADNPPVFTSAASASFQEETTGVVYTAIATDDIGPVTYSLGTANDESLFALNGSNGELTFLSAPDFETPLDGNADNDYLVEVIASDGTNTTSLTVTVSVTDVVESGDITYSFDANVGTITSFGAFPVTGADAAYPFTFTSSGTGSGSISNFGGKMTLAVSGGNISDYVHTVSRTDAANFDLQSLTVENGFGFAGNVIITGFRNGNPVATTTETMPTNFQAVFIDLTGNDDFNDVSQFQVTYSGTLGTAWSFRDITIGDAIPAPDAPPVFTSGTTATFAEETTGVVYTATATDDIGPVTYSLGTANDESLFALNGSNGELTFLSAPDFETPLDGNADNDYLVEVIASDGTNTTSLTVTVSVTDVVESGDITYSFDANVGTITSFGAFPVTGADAAYPFTFTSSGTGSGSISNFGGKMTLAVSGGNISDYVHTVSRTDAANFDLQSLTVENGFGFAGNVIITGFRNGNPVATTTETMPTNFQAVFIDLTGNDDFNDVSQFQVTYSGTLGTAWSFRDISIGDAIPAPDAPPVFTSGTTATFAEETTGVVYTATATDDIGPVTYSLGTANDESLFALNGSNGELTFLSAPDFETPLDGNADNDYLVEVIASDGTNTTSLTVTVSVTDVVESGDITYSFDANVGTITSFGAFPVTGADAAYPFTFTSSGTGSGSISNFGGKMTLAVSGGNISDYVHTVSRTDAANFDLQSLTVENGFGFAGNVIITGFRNGNPVATTTETMPTNFQAVFIDLTGNDDFNDVSQFQVTYSGTLGTAWSFRDITIGDAIPAPDAPPVFTSGTTATFAEETTGVVYTATATDDIGPVTYSLGTANDESLFALNGSNGELTFLSAPDFETPLDGNADNDYLVEVIASDGTNTTSLTVTVSVTDVVESGDITYSFDANVGTITSFGAFPVTGADAAYPFTFTSSGTGSGSISNFGGKMTLAVSGGNISDYVHTVSRTDAANFDLQSLTVENGFGFAGNVIITGFRNGNPVATSSATMPANFQAVFIDLTGNDDFNDVSEFQVTYSGTLGTAWSFRDITIGDAIPAPDTPPVVTVNDITVDNDSGICGAVIASFGATATDDSGIATFSFDIPEGSTFAVGTTTVTATATDDGGQTTQATFDVTVNDTEVPVLTLVGNANVNLGLGDAYAEAGATVADNCPSPSAVTIGGAVVDTNTLGTYVVTYNATDAAGNSAAQITRTVNVVDNADPVITVNDITVANDTGVCGAVVASFSASATDDSGTANLSYDIAEGTQFAVGTTTVTATATDPSGNSAQATFEVTVNDTEAPVLTLNGNASLDIDLGDVYTESGATVSDNCPSPSAATVGGDGVNTAIVGTYTVTYDATDAAGNAAAQISRTVNVVDNVTPVFTSATTASFQEETTGVVYTATATDNSGNVNLSLGNVNDEAMFSFNAASGELSFLSPPDFETPLDGNADNDYLVEIIASDGTNSISQVVTVTVTDVFERTTTYSFTDNVGTIAAFGANPISGSNAAYPFLWTSEGTGSGSISNFSDKIIMAVVGGDIADYVHTVSRTDAANFDLESLTIENGFNFVGGVNITGFRNGNQVANQSAVMPANFDAVFIDLSGNDDFNDVSEFQVTFNGTLGTAWSFRDITIADAIPVDDPPVLTVNDITVGNDTGICSAVVASFGASATDDSGTAILSFDIPEGSTFAVGTTTVTATATDDGGQTTQATFDVTVNDTEVPVLALVGSAIVNLNIGDSYTEEGASVTDNCPAPSAIIIGGDVVNTNVVGAYTVTYNATDAAGNVAAQVTRTVNVLDNVGPVITVNDININSEPGECGANIFDYGATATDPSGIADFNFSIPEGSFFDPGTTEVIAFASDNNGNVSQVTFNVTVNDVEAPTLIARGITVELDENGQAQLPPLNPEVILFQGTFDDDTPALNTNSLVNWNVTGGNVDVYFANQFGSPFNDNALELAGSVNGAIESKETFTLEPGNYLFSFEARGFNGDAAIGIDIGNVLNTSFTDFTGVRQTVVFEFTVTQTTTATIRLNEFGGGDAFSGTLLDNLLLQKIADSILISASDNCGIESITPSVTEFGCNELGTQQVTLTVRDEAGNEASETVDVQVVDNLAPTFATRESFILLLDENGQASVTPADYNLGTVLDNCGVDRIEFDRTDFGCGDVGFHVINVTAFDASGNATTTQVDVEVRDEIAPVFLTRESFIIFLDANGNASLTPDQYNTATIQTNCDLDRVEFNRTDFGCGDVGFLTIDVTAFDGNGLATTTQADVEVRDEIGPVVETRDITVFLDESGNASITAADVDAGSNDNCGIAELSVDVTSFDCSNLSLDSPGSNYSLDPNGLNSELLASQGRPLAGVGTAKFNGRFPELDNTHAFTFETMVKIVGNDVNSPVVIFTTAGSTFGNGINITAPKDASGNAYKVTATMFDNRSRSTSDPGTGLSIDFKGPIAFAGLQTVEAPLQRDQWHHVAVVFDGLQGELRIYIDGVRQILEDHIFGTSFLVPGSIMPNNVTLLNAELLGSFFPYPLLYDYDLRLDEVRLWDVVRTQAQIESNRNGILRGDEPGLFTYLNFEEGPGNNMALDISGNGHNLILLSNESVGTQNGILTNEFFSSDVSESLSGGSGSVPVLLTATDSNGNITSGIANVTVLDSIAPTITLLGDAVVEVDLGSPYFEQGADVIENCDAPLVIEGEVDVNTLGTYIVTYNAVDQSGNAAREVTRTVNVIPVDVEGPVITANDVTAFTIGDRCSAVVNSFGVTATDESGVASITFSLDEGASFETGTTSVTATATDNFGNTSTATFNVTVIDNVAPTFDANDVTVALDENGEGTLVVPTAPFEIFSDDFEAETPELSVNALSNWNVTQGNIDVFEAAAFSLPTTTTSIELAGNVNGAIETKTAFLLEPGNYRLRFDYRGATGEAAIGIDIGTVLGASISDFTGEFFEPAEFDFVVTQTTSATIRFNEFGGGQGIFGTIIDNVRLLRQPDNGIVSNVYDNCQVTSITASKTDFTCADIGQQPVTVTVADAAGNETTADIIVNVVDNLAPIFATRESFILLLDENGQASVTPADYNLGTVLDNCGVDRIEFDRTEFGCGDVGFHVINVTAFDAAGNSSTTQADVEIRDEIAPVFLTRESFITFLDANGNASLTPDQYNTATIQTNCDLDRVEFSRTDFGCGDVGSLTIDVTAFDGNGLATTTQADVEVRDEIAPTVITQNISVNLDASGNVTITAGQIDNGSTDNCDIASLSLSQTSFDCSNVGVANVVSLTVIDVNGNSSSATATVTVNDITAPVVNVQDISINLDASGNATITPQMIDNGSTDNCGIAGIALSQTSFDCSNVGVPNVVSLIVTDVNGNESSATAVVTVNDVTAPVASAMDLTVVLDEAGNATITAEDINDGSSDNCGIESLSIDRTVFDCDDVGEQNIVTLTVTDANGNSSTAQATVTVSDVTGPVLEVKDITLQLDANGQASLPALTAQTQIFYDDFSSDDPALRKTDLVNWNVIDGDVDVFFPNQFGLPFSTNALDVAGDVNGIIESKQSFLFEPGEYRLTFTVLGNNGDARLELEIGNLLGTTTFTDFIGGTIETRSVDFTVTSTTSATIVFSEFGDAPFFSGTTIDDIELSRLGEELVSYADDACGIASITADVSSFTCADIGTQIVTITATDANGNTSTAQANVTISDELAPVVLTQDIEVELGANGTATITAQDVNAGTSDNCSFSLSLDQTSFDCQSIGNQTVRLTATDPSGNSASAEANVLVVDATGPVIDTGAIEVQLDENGEASVSLADVEGLVSDNCGVANVSFDTATLNCDNLGRNVLNITATDVNGNSTTGAITVNVIDIIPPVVATEDIELSLDENGQAAITADDVLILSEDEIDTGEECTVSAAEHHAVWLSQYVKKRGSSSGGDDDDDDDDSGWWNKKRSGNGLNMHNRGRRKGKGKGRGRGDDDDDDDDRHHRPENTRFVFDANGGTLNRNADGTATITGTIRSTANANDQWVVSLNLENARNWTDWSAMDRSYKDEAGLAHRRYQDWTYYEMAAGSKLIGEGINAGDEIALSHAPADFRYGFQLGEAANSKNGNFGLSGWFFYTNRKGNVVQGDFNLDVTDCTPNTPPSEAIVTSDNCSLGDITLSQSVFTCDDIGVNQISVTVADQSGNETTAMATVTISDDLAPVAAAQDITVSLGPDGTVTIDPQAMDGGSTDNCAIVSYGLSQDTFTCDDITEDHHYYGYYWWWKKHQKKGTRVTLTVTDAAGNTDSAEAYVTVVDDTAPVISEDPVTIVVYGKRKERLRYVDVASRVTDNCRVKWIHFPYTRYSRKDAGMNTVPVTAKDGAGNVTTGLLNVEVIDISNLGKRVELCYDGQTKRVSKGAVQHWLRKGATLGSCATDLSMTVGAPDLNESLGELASEPLIELGAFPNPTRGETVIKFSSNAAGPASVGVISPNGVKLTTLFDGEIEANQNNEVRYNTSQLPSGVYIVRMVTAGEVKNLKLMVKK